MKKKLIIALMAIVATLCCALGFAACGDKNESGGGSGSENGTYYYVEFDGSIYKGSYYSLSSGKWKNDDGESGTYKIKDNKIVFYVYEELTKKDEEWASGTLTDGVIKLVDGLSKETYVSENHKHSFGEYEVETELSCTVDGVEVSTCPCGAKDRKITECVGHHTGNWVTEKEATCTETGLRTINCSECKQKIYEDVEMLEHELSDWLQISSDHYKICSTCKQAFNMANHDNKSLCSVCGYPFKFTLNSAKDGYYVSYTKTDIKTLTVPDTFNGKPVVGLRYDAFKDCAALTEITLPDSVKSIGENAFGNCVALTKITIPNGVTKIYNDAFSGCSSLTEITLPDALKEIGSNAFGGCTSLAEINIPDGVTKIYNDAFDGCSSLASITVDNGNSTYKSVNNCIIETASKTLIIGCKTAETYEIPTDGSVTTIGEKAFADCSALTDITFNDNVTGINKDAFSNCTSLKNIRFNGKIENWCNIYGLGNLMAQDRTLYVNGEELTELVIPDGVTKISEYAFYYCKNITRVIIPDSVTASGNYAFTGCDAIKTAKAPAFLIGHLPKSNTEEFEITSGASIIQSAFANCASLVSVKIPDTVINIGNSAFIACTSLVEIQIPDSVTELGGGVFYGCTKLETVKLGNQITSLSYCSSTGKGFFEDCTELSTITIPETLTQIGKNAFKYCTSLKSITIPDKVKNIGDSAFSSCTALESVTLGKGVTAVGEKAFDGCTSLAEIKYAGDIALWCAIDGLDNLDLSKVCFGEEKLQEITSLVIPDGVTEIKDYAFNGCENLSSLTVPDSVTKIGASAFAGCNSIKKATIPSLAIKSLSKANLEEVIITSGESLVYNTFKDCTSLVSVSLPETLTTIYTEVFENCTSLTKITYDGDIAGWCAIDGLYNLDLSLAFIRDKKLHEMTSVIIPDGVTRIESGTFSGCSLLDSIKIPDSVIHVGKDAFKGCDNLTEMQDGIIYADNWAVGTIYDPKITYPNRLKEDTRGIASCALEYAYGGWTHYIPASVTAIGDRAFYTFNEKNTNITFGGTMEQWNAIYKADRWNETGNGLRKYTIRCTDGNIEIS